MIALHRPAAAVSAMFVLALVLTACSNNVGATPSTSAASAAAPAASSSADASTGAAGGATGDACALLPAADVQTALGVTGITTTAAGVAGASGCSYHTADGTPVLATVYTASGGGAQFDSLKSAQGAVQIPGVADGAAFINPTLYVKKGDALLAAQLTSTANMTPDKLQQIATALGTAIAGHM
jgi:Protein of unknown function (DUF3558)